LLFPTFGTDRGSSLGRDRADHLGQLRRGASDHSQEIDVGVRCRWDHEAMRPHCALYVDAGYLLAAAATRVTGTSLRSGIHVEYGPLVRDLIRQVESESGLPLLRVHWYDSARDGVPDRGQERIGELPQVKLRLGRFGVDGQQKGVDLRMGLDLVNHARHRTADVFFLLSGDDDLSEAVEEAQAQGVQVLALAVPTKDGKAHGVSRHLIRAADSVVLVKGEAIDGAVMKVEVPTPSTLRPESIVEVDAVPSPELPHAPTPNDLLARPRPKPMAPVRSTIAYTSSSGRAGHQVWHEPEHEKFEDQIQEVVRNVVSTFKESATPEDLAALERARPSIPRDIDSALLMDLSDVTGFYDLSDDVRYRLRAAFWEAI